MNEKGIHEIRRWQTRLLKSFPQRRSPPVPTRTPVKWLRQKTNKLLSNVLHSQIITITKMHKVKLSQTQVNMKILNSQNRIKPQNIPLVKKLSNDNSISILHSQVKGPPGSQPEQPAWAARAAPPAPFRQRRRLRILRRRALISW